MRLIGSLLKNIIERVSRGLTGYRQEYSDAVPCRRCVPGSILGKLHVLLLAAAVSVPFQASAAESATTAAAPEAGDEYGEEEDDDSLSPDELYNAGLEGLGGQSETMTCDGGLSLLLEAAVDGYAPAQAALGTAYYQGAESVRVNYPEAEKWLRKAAEQGNADGEYFLGMAYSFGNGVEIDFKKALELYRKAAAQGDTRAMSSVAEAYGSGNGVERDVQEELRWFRKACSAGSKNACGLLESITPETGNLRCFEENR